MVIEVQTKGGESRHPSQWGLWGHFVSPASAKSKSDQNLQHVVISCVQIPTWTRLGVYICFVLSVLIMCFSRCYLRFVLSAKECSTWKLSVCSTWKLSVTVWTRIVRCLLDCEVC
jgi:hypothetical protein